MKNQIKFRFNSKGNAFLEKIQLFGKKVQNQYSFRECPLNIKDERKYIVTGEYKNIITKTGNNGWIGTICLNELDKSIEEHKWKIKILNTQSQYIMVGVAPSDFDINSSTHNTCGYYLYCIILKLYSGPPFNYGGISTNLSQIKEEIIVVMNMKKRTLKFIINNEDKGDSYSNIPIDKSLFPAIILYHQNDSVQIIEI